MLPVIASRKDAVAPGLSVRDIVAGEITLMGFTSSFTLRVAGSSAPCRAPSLGQRRAHGLSKTCSETYSVPGSAAERSNQPVPNGEGGGFAAIGHAEFGQDARHMVARRARTQEERLGDLR